jgi:MerR family Zn(II)-responsive transcriptional regulator of zntA
MRNVASDATFQIGELSARSGMTPDTLRYYERLGLLPRAHRTSGGFRVYTDQTLDRLRFIKQAQTLGLTLQEIRDLVSYQTSGGLTRCRDVRDMLRSKMADLEVRIADLQAFHVTLSRYLEDCERTLGVDGSRRSDPNCPVIETLSTKKG